LSLYLVGERQTDRETKRRAEAISLARRKELNQGEGDPGERRRESFVQFVRDIANTKSGNTKKSWLSAAKHLRDCFPGGLSFGKVNRRNLEDFRKYLLEKLGQPSSAALYLGHVKAAVNVAVEENILPFDPSRKVKIKSRRRLPVHFTLDELRKLQETSCRNKEVKTAFLFSAFSGLRISDIEGLKWVDVNFVGRYIEFVQKKTGRPERLPLGAQARKLLKEQQRSGDTGGHVFSLPHRSTINDVLKAWARDAGIEKNISYHKARHSFAVLATRFGVDLFVLSRLLGHSSVAITQLYAQVVDEQKKKAVEKLPTLRGKTSR